MGSGKTQALCAEAVRLAYKNPERTGLIGAPTYPMLRDATQAALMEVLLKNKIPHEWNRAENFLVLRETGSRILFRAVEEFERLRGSNLAWFGVDELTYTSEDAWLRLEGRLRDPKASRLCGTRRQRPLRCAGALSFRRSGSRPESPSVCRVRDCSTALMKRATSSNSLAPLPVSSRKPRSCSKTSL